MQVHAHEDSRDDAGVAPGFPIPFTENLWFVAHLGRVGYFNDTFVMGADATNVLAGLYYSF